MAAARDQTDAGKQGAMTMNVIRTLMISFFLASAFGGPAEAHLLRGDQLYRDCTPTDKEPVALMRSQFCSGIILGHYEMLTFLDFDCGDDANKDLGQIRDVVVKYLKEHPAERGEPAERISFRAIIEAFKCLPRIQSPESRPARLLEKPLTPANGK